MTYRVLARKWRPSSFAELVGQTHVLGALENALESGRIHHAYLLTGTRGVGKTTIARILARCFNCEVGMSSKPCGECTACNEIADGRSLDLIEVDAASRTKVEDTRELLENSQFAPSHGRYKIYLIDEVHMLSNHSFNALLKTLEEPPEHVIFIFATTHPQKIPVTVLSRCLQFHLKNLLPEQISEHLETILAQENVTSEAEALAMIAHAAQGSMRDALSITEQAIAFGNDTVQAEQVKAMLGVVESQVTVDLLSAIASGETETTLDLLHDFASQTVDFVGLLDALMSLTHRVSLEQLKAGLGADAQLQHQDIENLAHTIDPGTVQVFYQTLLTGKRDIAYAPDPLTGIEMILLRMIAFRPMLQGDMALSAHSNTSVEGSESEVTGKTKKPESPSEVSVERHSQVSPASAQIQPSVEPAKGPASSNSALQQDASSAADHSLAAFSSDEAVALDAFNNESWCASFSGIPLSGLVRAVIEHCTWLDVKLTDGEPEIQLALLESNSSLYKKEHDKKLADSLSIYFSQAVKVAVTIVASPAQLGQEGDTLTPAIYREQKEQQRRDDAVSTMQSDENVKKLLETFDATLDTDNISMLE